MSKIIKPLLNKDGTQAIRQLKKGEWYYLVGFNNGYCEYEEGRTYFDTPIYYAEEWRPKELQVYYYYSFETLCSQLTKYTEVSKTNRERLKIGNCFETTEDAENPKNVLKVLDNMKKYYQEKLKGGGDEKL